MQLPYLMRLIESKAEELTREVMVQLRESPETPYLRHVEDKELRRRVQDLYANLGRWVTARAGHDVRIAYRQLGAQRCEEGVAAAEVVYALLAVKGHLWEFIRRNAPCNTSVELYQEDELF